MRIGPALLGSVGWVAVPQNDPVLKKVRVIGLKHHQRNNRHCSCRSAIETKLDFYFPECRVDDASRLGFFVLSGA
jgi:hypothetical protein